MALFRLLFVSFLPLAVWVLYLAWFRQLKMLPAVRFVCAGMGAVLVSSVLQSLLDPLSASLTAVALLAFRSFIEAALIEESVKFAFIRIQPESRALARGGTLLPGVLVSALTFAALENLVYSLREPSVIFLRTLTAVPLHGATALIAASTLLYGRRGIVYLMGAVILHGAYNFSVNFGGPFVAAAPVLLIVAIVWAYRLYSEDREAHTRR